MLKIGSIVGGTYRILHIIGRGGMSVVYLAMNEKVNKQWAIKEVSRDGIRDFDMVRQGICVEVNMLKKLHHRNLPSIVDVIEEKDRILIVMDYIEGISLEKALAQSVKGYLQQDQVIDIARQLCDVLCYLHSRNPPVIYRDMKPSNIMLRPDGRIILIDFGTAREFKEHKRADTTILGTAGYAAPEQYGGHGQTDERTDIFCLGATLYHLVTGQNPCDYPYGIFPFQDYPIRYWNQSLSSGLEAILLRCTKSRPDERYRTCQELSEALAHYERLEEGYIKRQMHKRHVFSSLCMLFICSVLLNIGVHFRASYLRTHNYDTFIRDAQSGGVCPTDEEKIRKLRDAILMDPVREEAYMALLDGYGSSTGFQGVFLADGIFTREEDETLRNILNESGIHSGRRNRDRFAENKKWFGRFSYHLGIAYYYYYEDFGSKEMAAEWLAIASESSGLKAKERVRAAKLLKISHYFDKIGVESRSGDENTRYSDYWEDLTACAEGDLLEETENRMTAAAVYHELALRIYLNAAQFKAAGIEKEQMTEQLSRIQEGIQEITDDEGYTVSDTLNKLITETLEFVSRGEKQIEIAYKGQVDYE